MPKTPSLSSIDITPRIPEGVNIINSYGLDYFVINGKKVEYDLILSSNIYNEYKGQDDILKIISKIEEEHILIFGSNNEIARSDFMNFVSSLKQEKILFETMQLASACRTYNVLTSDGRNVIVILVRG